MKVKNIKLEWYAFRYNSNKNKIEWFNVLDKNLKENIYKEISRKKINDFDGLKDYVKRHLMYYYWCKCEHEVAVCYLFDINEENATKIDVYSQLEPNLDRIVEYIMNIMDIKF